MRHIYLIAILAAVSNFLFAQSTAYVFHGGLTIANQKWDNNFDREPLFAWHGALSIETVDNEEDKGSLFAQIGYHVKGSATRFIYTNINSGLPGGVFTEEFRFNNISLLLGAKSKKPLGSSDKKRWYYFGGVRGDYTLSSNIDNFSSGESFQRIYYPQIAYMNRWLFGVSAGVGIEFTWNELVGGEVKLSVSPDFTLQYNQPAIPNVIDPFQPGRTITISERRIRNTAVELSFGLRLLRKVEYVD